jgi:hypothetical protein
VIDHVRGALMVIVHDEQGRPKAVNTLDYDWSSTPAVAPTSEDWTQGVARYVKSPPDVFRILAETHDPQRLDVLYLDSQNGIVAFEPQPRESLHTYAEWGPQRMEELGAAQVVLLPGAADYEAAVQLVNSDREKFADVLDVMHTTDRRSALIDGNLHPPGKAPSIPGKRVLEPNPAAPRKPRPQAAARIQPDPIRGGEAKPLDKIIFDLGAVLGAGRRKRKGGRVRVGRTHRSSVGGTYFPGSAKTLIRFAGDLDTAAHEVAHALDDKYSVLAQWYANRVRSPFDDELMPHFSAHGSSATSGPRARLRYRRGEGMAEWVRAWLVNPQAAEKAAPKFAAHFRGTMPPAVLAGLEAFSRDVRTFAGLNPVERTGANVESEGRRAPVKERLRKASRKIEAQLLDELAPVMRAVRAAKELTGQTDLLPSQDPEVLMRLLNGFNGKIGDIMEHGMVDALGARIAGLEGGISALLSPLDTSSTEALEADKRGLVAYMIAQRTGEKAGQVDAEAQEALDQLDEQLADGLLTQEKYDRRRARILTRAEARKSRLTGIGGGIFADDAQARQILAEVAKDPARKARYDEAAELYRAWSDAVLRYMVDKGRLTEEKYNAIAAANQQYVALNRILETVDGLGRGRGGGKLASVGDPLKRFHGSTRRIEDPYVSLLRNTMAAMKEADRNEALRSFAELLRHKRDMHEGQVRDLDQIGALAKADDADTVRVFVDGKEERWQFDDDILAALRGWGVTQDNSGLMALATIPGRVLRWGVTNAPDFLIRNVIRDATHRSMMSRTGGKPWDILRGFSRSDTSEFRRAGGDQAGYWAKDREQYYAELRRHMDKLANDRSTILGTPAALLRGWEKIASSSELVGRMAEYRSAREHAKTVLGYDDREAQLYAAAQARDLIDYAVAGTLVRQVNRLVPFTNPAVQGIRRSVRAAKENPRRLAKLWTYYSLLPTLLIYAWNLARGDDELEEYRQLPAYLRDFFWNLKVGDDLWLRIPKSFEGGVLATGVERLLDRAIGQNPRAFDGYAGSLAKGLLPIDENAFLGPARVGLELMANHDFFRNASIVPPFEHGKAVESREGAHRATRLGKVIASMAGVAGAEIDPRMADYAVRAQVAGIGKMALRVSDLGREDQRSKTAEWGSALTGLFTNSPTYAAQDVQYVLRRAKYLGIEQKGRIKRFRALLREASDATDPREKDELGAQLREEARWLREELENEAPEPAENPAEVY